jgi:FtsH-binding integral membrane protein
VAFDGVTRDEQETEPASLVISDMPLVRRIVLLSVWPCLIASVILVFVRAPQLVIGAIFFFPLIAYLLTLRIIEPWLARHSANQQKTPHTKQ